MIPNELFRIYNAYSKYFTWNLFDGSHVRDRNLMPVCKQPSYRDRIELRN